VEKLEVIDAKNVGFVSYLRMVPGMWKFVKYMMAQNHFKEVLLQKKKKRNQKKKRSPFIFEMILLNFRFFIRKTKLV
jgi:hypothetical protein